MVEEGGNFMYFMNTTCFIEGNKKLRYPQIEAYLRIQKHFETNPKEEALVIMPTGSGKTGLISIVPFKVCRGRVLVITPGNITKKSIAKNMEVIEDNFWINYEVIFDINDVPNVLEYEPDVFDSDLRKANIVYTNIQKLNNIYEKSLLNRVGRNFFDMIIVDEAHHSPANTWQNVINYFDNAKVMHVTGTPYRGDGKPVPGKVIHETKLSEVMEQKLVKWLRKKDITSEELYFINSKGRKFTVEEAIEFNDEDWARKSVAMSDTCSLQVIDKSIEELNRLKELSPNVPHKILAAACNIGHAQIIHQLYTAKKMKPVLIHSEMEKQEIDRKLADIELHKYNVIVNVDMMREGYDHRYITIVAIFRPYKSLNAFAQVIGRALRIIPDDEVMEYGIDNNACVIYHKELKLGSLWEYFSKEVEISKRLREIKEYIITEQEFEHRKSIYGDVLVEGEIVESIDSYVTSLDFNVEFEKAISSLRMKLEEKRKMYAEKGLNKEEIEILLKNASQNDFRSKNKELEELYNEKRPAQRRKFLKGMLNKKIQLLAAELLSEANIDENGYDLHTIFNRFVHNLKPDTKNDGIVCRFINAKLSKNIGKREVLEIEDLQYAEEFIENNIKPELRRILNERLN